MSLPYFPMYPTDFEAKTSHLTLAEDGAYNRLMRLMWMTHGCSLPDDDAWIKRRMRCSEDEFESVVRVVIDEFCERKGGRVSNARLVKVFEESSTAHKKRVLAGSKGGKAKSLQNNKNNPSNAKPMPKQPEPEPEPYKEEPKGSLSLVPTDDQPDECSKAIELFKAAAADAGWPIPRILSQSRKSALKARLKECGGIEGWRVAIDKAKASKHCCGQNDRGWVLTFDFITNANSFAKLMEGNYDNRDNNSRPAPNGGGMGRPTATQQIADLAIRRAKASQARGDGDV